MADNNCTDPTKSASDLQQDMERRKAWFFECQLRKLNLESFRNVSEIFPDALLGLVSGPLLPAGFPAGQVGVQTKELGRVYLDSQQPVWTIEEREQRHAFAETTTGGGRGNWLNLKQPKRIAEQILALKKLFEESHFSSVADGIEELIRFGRKDASTDSNLPHAMSRVQITSHKPWLIPELYNTPNAPNTDPKPVEKWLENAELFVSNYEKELLQILGKAADTAIGFDKKKPEVYRMAMQSLIQESLVQNPSQSVKVSFLGEEKGKTTFDVKIETAGFPLKKISDYSFSKSLLYWSNAFNLQEIYLNAENSDMGLCLLMRSVYLYGNLPSSLGTDDQLVWRKWRKTLGQPGEKFKEFFSTQANDPFIKDDLGRKERLETVKTKMDTMLKLSATHPRCASLQFSLLNAEIIKQAILGYKFWLDEPYHAYDYHGEDRDENKPEGINKARKDIGKGKLFSEMEYWSENHYIMFASSEYLAGQLWQDESFQPARDFLKPEDKDKKFGVLTGKQRMERGKARILKWLNNRLLFGWTEFNSSGYYREHLWALLNLVDFALDEEVRKKAIVVTDLLLFDVVRFLHKGSMGACGGRSQFKSKNNGWDNALGDVVEIMLGTQGIFLDGGGEIGCSFATSSYKTPDVFLEIGCFPPEGSFIDRSRVSISFEEAPKYGIQYSQKSDQKDSLEQGFAPKRKKHFKALDKVNKDIEVSHTDYGAMEDDTVFWWSLSAYYNKQVVRNTFKCVLGFKLEQNEVFATLKTVVDVLSYFIRAKDLLLVATLPVAKVLFVDDVFSNHLENASEELTIFLDGSTRSRANIYTYRNRDVMLSTIQNFRTGQLNLQSNVNQATISTEINVFTTSGFPGLSISDLPFALGGALGGALGAYTLGFAAAGGAIAGGVAGVLGNELGIEGDNPFGDQGDGPGWWTGYWALPMVVQHENTAIIAYDSHWMQRRLTDDGSHVWFPKNAFDQVEERRSSADDDENFFLFDITDIGPKGFWIFGKKLHKKDPQNPDADEEGYIGVFSNQRPKWQDKDSDFYSDQIKEKNEKALEKIEDDIEKKLDELQDQDTVGYLGRQIIETVVLRSVNGHLRINHYISKEQLFELVKKELSQSRAAVILKNIDKIMELVNLYFDQLNHRRTWANPLPVDYFADKDWYVDGKNIWIIQMGNKKDYGSFDNFKDRVSRAKVEIDDVGDMECVYHIPKPNGGSQALSLKYKEESKLDGNTFQTDFYPRFENPFLRGGLVEWGQREYVIEYRGKSLLHDFSIMDKPEKCENAEVKPEDLDTIKALVIYIRTGDEDMDLFSVAQATVKVGCGILATDEIVAAGEVEEDTAHDAEWVFFDKPGLLMPDMTIEIKHPPTSKGDDDPEWKMSFSLKALLGDRRLYDCSISFPGCHFEDERRSTGQIPFTVQVSRWRTWQIFEDMGRFNSWQIANQPGWEPYYYDYLNLLAIDNNKRLWHRRLEGCSGPNSEWKAVGTTGQSLFFAEPISLCSISTQPNNLFLFAMNNGELFNCFAWPSEDFSKKQWTKLTVETIPTTIFGLPIPNAAPVPVALSQQTRIMAKVSADWQGGADLYLSGADHNFYSHLAWLPGSTKTWRQIATDSVFTPLAGAAFEVCADHLFVLDDRQRLWVGPIDNSDLKMTPSWKQLSDDQTKINNFSVAQKGKALTILINANQGEIRASGFTSTDDPVIWERVGAGINFRTFAKAKLAWAFPREDHLDIFTTGTDGKIYTTYWNAQQGWEIDHSWNVIDPKGHQFENPESGGLVVLNRVNNQLEIFTSSHDNKMWKTWWS